MTDRIITTKKAILVLHALGLAGRPVRRNDLIAKLQIATYELDAAAAELIDLGAVTAGRDLKGKHTLALAPYGRQTA